MDQLGTNWFRRLPFADFSSVSRVPGGGGNLGVGSFDRTSQAPLMLCEDAVGEFSGREAFSLRMQLRWRGGENARLCSRGSANVPPCPWLGAAAPSS